MATRHKKNRRVPLRKQRSYVVSSYLSSLGQDPSFVLTAFGVAGGLLGIAVGFFLFS